MILSMPMSCRMLRRLLLSAPLVLAAGCATPGVGPSYRMGIEPSIPRVVQAPPGPLTLEAAIAHAVQRSDRIASLRGAVDAAAEAFQAAGDWRDPELRVQYGRESTRAADDEGEGYRAGLRVFPPNPWARSARVTAAEARLYAARAELRHAQWQTATEVRRLFVRMHYAEKTQQLLGETAALHKELRQLTKELLKKGQATLAEDMAASHKYLKSISDRHQAVREYLSLRQSLACLVGLPVESLQIVDDEPNLTSMDFLSGETEGLELTALRCRADLSAGLWRAAAAKAAYHEAGAERIPWFNHVEGSLGRGWETGDKTRRDGVMSDEPARDEWRVGMGISIPVFSWFSSSSESRREASGEIERQNRALAERISAEIRSAVHTLKRIRDQRRLYESESGPVLEDMKSLLARVEKESGLAPGERLRIREQILMSRRFKLQADVEYGLAAIELLETLGTDPAAGKRE